MCACGSTNKGETETTQPNATEEIEKPSTEGTPDSLSHIDKYRITLNASYYDGVENEKDFLDKYWEAFDAGDAERVTELLSYRGETIVSFVPNYDNYGVDGDEENFMIYNTEGDLIAEVSISSCEISPE